MKELSLQDQLNAANKAALEATNQANAIKKQIELENAKNKPKTIMDRVSNFDDILKEYGQMEPLQQSILDYKGDNIDLKAIKAMTKLIMITTVLNEGKINTMNPSDNRYYPWFWITDPNVSSGFDFNRTHYAGTGASTGSASRLCFVTRELAKFAGETFLQEYRDFIICK